MEVWKDVLDFCGLYQVSNQGDVKRLHGHHCKSDRILKPYYDKDGYQRVQLFKDGKCYNKRIHRLVAEAFIPNPLKLPIINHKDENKTNNYVWVNIDGSIDDEKSNLEWCTVKYNNNYGKHNEKVNLANIKAGRRNKTVLEIDKNGNIVNEWDSPKQIELTTGIPQSLVSKCCRGERTHARNRYFIYK